MKRTHASLRFVLAAVLLAVADLAGAQEAASTVDGVTAYFGVVPSALARDWLKPHGASERDAHGRVTPASANHHFLIALFDATTGQRIGEADVSASHTPDPGRDGVKALEPMRIGDATTFGNFFALSGSSPQRFSVTVRLPHHDKPLSFSFVYIAHQGPTP